jgi:hypothetical protein
LESDDLRGYTEVVTHADFLQILLEIGVFSFLVFLTRAWTRRLEKKVRQDPTYMETRRWIRKPDSTSDFDPKDPPGAL